MTDEQILLLIRDKSASERGYRLLMDQYQGLLYQHIRRIVNDHDDTNDVLQNTFLKVFRNIGKFEGRSSLYTWIYRIATNEALSYIGKARRLKGVFNNSEGESDLENKLTANNSPEGEKIAGMLQAAMKTLPEKQKCIFSLRYYEEMSYKQIASITGTTEGALKASFHHAVKKIEHYFKQENIY
jgi:RNA polymerase sigma-70 factor (ECF subfamily)